LDVERDGRTHRSTLAVTLFAVLGASVIGASPAGAADCGAAPADNQGVFGTVCPRDGQAFPDRSPIAFTATTARPGWTVTLRLAGYPAGAGQAGPSTGQQLIVADQALAPSANDSSSYAITVDPSTWVGGPGAGGDAFYWTMTASCTRAPGDPPPSCWPDNGPAGGTVTSTTPTRTLGLPHLPNVEATPPVLSARSAIRFLTGRWPVTAGPTACTKTVLAGPGCRLAWRDRRYSYRALLVASLTQTGRRWYGLKGTRATRKCHRRQRYRACAHEIEIARVR
jgi:hypothetical protein